MIVALFSFLLLKLYHPLHYVDQFPWFVKVYYWLGLGSYLPAFRKLKAVLTDCMKERKRKAKAKQVETL